MTTNSKIRLVCVVVAALIPAVGGYTPTRAAVQRMPAGLVETLGNLPLLFVENAGQFDPRVSYYIQGRDNAIYFTPGGMTLALAPAGQDLASPHASRAAEGRTATEEPGRWVVKLDFQGANPEVKPLAEAPLDTVISYFKGPPEQWRTGLKTYGRIRYPELWPGIDLVYSGTVNRLKYQFEVKPGADPRQIRLAYRGAGQVMPTESGRLEVTTPVAAFHDDRPVAWQEVDGRLVEVGVDYAMEPPDGELHAYGFRLGSYAPDRPLVIDPAVIVYAGYVGGVDIEMAYSVAVDAVGCAYITGGTSSTASSFPDRTGPDLTHNGKSDAFVAKVKADGTGLVYAGYIGGSENDTGRSIAVDAAGNAYVLGATNSYQPGFPAKVGPDLTYNGVKDAFVAKVNASGTDLVYAGYIGGNDSEEPYGIAVDAAGNAYVTGWTGSTEESFPVKGGPGLTYSGGGDAFVAKVSASGKELVYAGYIGGSGGDVGYGIAVNGAGNAYVVGYTSSDQTTFPVRVGPRLTYSGGTDAFVAKVGVSGRSLVYAGYIGGIDQDVGQGIAVDGEGCAYVTGATRSDENSFPKRIGPFLKKKRDLDAFVAKVNASGTGLVYAGYIGGDSMDGGTGIAVDISGNAYVTGYTYSDEASFPVAEGPGLTLKGFTDAFVAKVKRDGSSLVYAGYIGGTDYDYGEGIAVDRTGNAYVTGYTRSNQLSFPVTIGPDRTYNGNFDAFVAKVRLDAPKKSSTWYLDFNGNGSWNGVPTDHNHTFGLPGDRYVAGKWKKGVSRDRIGIVRGNTWQLDSGNGLWDNCAIDLCYTFGQAWYVPVVGDWNGDGKDEIGFVRGNLWRLDHNGNGVLEDCDVDPCYIYGEMGDVPVVGDWDGDGKAEIGIVRGNVWHLDYNGDGIWDDCDVDRCYAFGMVGDVPVVGDWNGDGKDEIGVNRRSVWQLDYNGNGVWNDVPKDRRYTFRLPLETPVVGDWNGDGKDEIGTVKTDM